MLPGSSLHCGAGKHWLFTFHNHGVEVTSFADRSSARRSCALRAGPFRSTRTRRTEAVLSRLKPGASGKEPLESKVLTAILGVSSVPYSAYVPAPKGFLHYLSAPNKQVWLLATLWIVAGARTPVRLAMTAACALVSVAALPSRLWRPQLWRLARLSFFIFVIVAIGSDSVPPVLTPRAPPTELQGLAGTALAPPSPYRYVLLDIWIITITRRSIALAVAASTLSFTTFQTASLCLTSTPAEEVALGLCWLLRPLQLLRLPVAEIGMTLLLSLRCMALVFEEVRNLALGLAARGVDWATLGPFGGIKMLLHLVGRLLSQLNRRAELIAVAMQSRGFVGPDRHQQQQWSLSGIKLHQLLVYEPRAQKKRSCPKPALRPLTMPNGWHGADWERLQCVLGCLFSDKQLTDSINDSLTTPTAAPSLAKACTMVWIAHDFNGWQNYCHGPDA
ncbi:hypothetical protein WJX74_006035 [Apatococcus lobatus]|uniref:Cobalt transport protein n=1 Tax=Apatococcus lobatus TaxID=904363 RepID=A0AAW1S2K2_9CHLO